MSPRLVAIVVLLGISIFINYIDRGNLSTAATLVQSELQISPSQLGFLLTAFFITYIPAQPLVGWLIDRFSASRILVAGFLIWSLATTVSGFAHGFGALFACRLLLGIGESVSFPTLSKIFAENVSDKHRGFANGVTQAGLSFGPAFGVFFGGNLIAAFGWRPFFIGTGLVSLLWVVAWLALAHNHVRQSDPSQGDGAPTMGSILRQRSLWGASAGHFGANFVLYFLVTWIPYYLVHQRHWSLTQMASIGGTTFLLGGVSVMACGTISDYLIRRGALPTLVRKAAFAMGALGGAIGLLGCGYSSGTASEYWLMFAGFALGFLGANTYVVGQTMAGPLATGRWTGVQNTLGNLAGLIAPSLTGVLVEKTGSFTIAFTIAAAMALASGAAWVFLVGPIVRIEWPRRITRAPSLP
jgi:MFS transporter, ACS family, D-galactonate transporter